MKKTRPRSTGGKTSARRVEATERAARALELRAAGYTLEAIAPQLGYRSRQAVHDAILRGLRATLRPAADELRSLDARRLDDMTVALWPAAMRGDVAAVTGLLRIMERRAKLLGLDAPVMVDSKLEATVDHRQYGVLVVPGPISEDEWEQEAARYQAELAEKERQVFAVVLNDAPQPNT